MYKNTPTDNEFWKFLLRSRALPISTGKAASTLETENEGEEEEEEEDGSSIKLHVKKRGSLNTDAGKNFRWFYTFVHQAKGHSGYVFFVDIRIHVRTCRGIFLPFRSRF